MLNVKLGYRSRVPVPSDSIAGPYILRYIKKEETSKIEFL